MSKHIVIVVEPNRVLRAGLKHIIENAGYASGGCVASIAELREGDAVRTDCTVVLRATDSDDIARSVSEIKALFKSARIVLIGGIDSIQEAVHTIQIGASVCLDNDADESVLVKAIELARSGVATMSLFGVVGAPSRPNKEAERHEISVDMPPGLDTPHADARHDSSQPSFSPREAAILQLLQEGAPNKLIARQLSLTESTVKVHLKSILRKIRVNNRTQAAVWAMTRNVVVGADEPDSSNDHVEEQGLSDRQLKFSDNWRERASNDINAN